MNGRQAGTDRAFEVLIREHHKRALGYALSLVRNDDVAEDLVQEAFLTAYRKIDSFDTTRNFGSWLRGIVRIKYLEWMRSRKESVMSEELLDAIESHYAEWDEASMERDFDVLEALEHCLSLLKDATREVVDAFYAGSMSCGEIADQMGITRETVKKRLERARGSLMICIRERLGMAQVTM